MPAALGPQRTPKGPQPPVVSGLFLTSASSGLLHWAPLTTTAPSQQVIPYLFSDQSMTPAWNKATAEAVVNRESPLVGRYCLGFS